MRSLFVFYLVLVAAAADATGKPASDAIASAHPLATEAGRLILEAGGNAFDAAVAISAALAVVEPYGSGLGGGGFWLLHRARDGRDVMIDGRERAPQAATADLLDAVVGQLAQLREAEDLVAPAVGEHRARPVHECVEPPEAQDPFVARTEVQVVGVAQDEAGTRGPDLFKGDRLDRPDRSHRHEDRGGDAAVAGGQKYRAGPADWIGPVHGEAEGRGQVRCFRAVVHAGHPFTPPTRAG